MIIVKIFGGLGNQMFQYAAGLALARKHSTELELDLSFFENPGKAIAREYGLSVFEISGNIASQETVAEYSPSTFLKQLRRLLPWYKRRRVQESHYHFTSDFFKIPNNSLIEGYFQSEKYFLEIKENLVKDFSLQIELSEAAEAWKQKIESTSSVSLHIRRGDYVESKEVSNHIGAQPLEYYKKAVAEIKKSIEDPMFFVFSDDIEWAKEHLEIENVEFVSDSSLQDYEEMFLMSKCTHNIIANSSFSWWGAWLNKHSEKMVIAPCVWFADGSNDTKDLIPESWIRI